MARLDLADSCIGEISLDQGADRRQLLRVIQDDELPINILIA